MQFGDWNKLKPLLLVISITIFLFVNLEQLSANTRSVKANDAIRCAALYLIASSITKPSKAMGEQSKEAKALSGLQMMFQGIFSTMEHERLNRTITNGMIREAKSKMATALGKQYEDWGWGILELEMRCNAWRIIITKQLKALGKGASKAQIRQVFRSVSGLPPSREKTNPRWESSEELITKSFSAWCKLGRPTPLSLINELLSPKPANKPKHNSNKEQTLPGCDHIPIFLSPTELIDKYYVAEEETVISEQDLINEANNGDAIDQFKLGLMYEAGKSSGGLPVTKSIKKAMKYWKKSAVQGYSLAQHELGVRYMAGVGVLKDKILAHMWFNIAASNGWGPSAGIRDNLEQKMTPSDIAIATNKAKKCLNSNYRKCGF